MYSCGRWMNRQGARVSPCNTCARKSNDSMAQSDKMTLASVSVWDALIACISFSGNPYAVSLSIILSNAFWMSIKVTNARSYMYFSTVFQNCPKCKSFSIMLSFSHKWVAHRPDQIWTVQGFWKPRVRQRLRYSFGAYLVNVGLASEKYRRSLNISLSWV